MGRQVTTDGPHTLGAVAGQEVATVAMVSSTGWACTTMSVRWSPATVGPLDSTASVDWSSGTVTDLINFDVLVETTRDGCVESVHCGSVVVVDAHGTVQWSVGDPHLVSFPRSSLKPFQALALVARGGVERFGLDSTDLAITCASHTAQQIHIDAVCGLLRKIDAHFARRRWRAVRMRRHERAEAQ